MAAATSTEVAVTVLKTPSMKPWKAARLTRSAWDTVAWKVSVTLAPAGRLLTMQSNAARPRTHELAGKPLIWLATREPAGSLSPTRMLVRSRPVLLSTRIWYVAR